ncbi:MAG: NAD-dependent epimerase/dehydratase family protein, partial [Chloroflexota bacterium]
MPPTTMVTGGTGFLGRHLVPALCRAGHTVRVLTRDPAAHPWLARYPRIEIIRGDILDAELIANAVEGCTYVVHAAGLFRFWGSKESFEATNVGGTENVLRAVVKTPIQKLIYVSTVALIGTPDPNRVVDEDHPAHPADNYQWSKLHAEELILRTTQQEGVPAVIMRPGAFYGPLGSYAFNRLFFKDPMRGIIMQVNGGRYVTFPVYIGDVAQAILRTFECGRVGEIYNVSGDSLTHKQAFDIICAEGNIHFPRLTIPGWLGIGVARLLTAFSSFTRQEPFWPITLRSYVYNYWNVSS